MELIPNKRYRYTYEAEGVARSDKSGINLDNGGSVEAADFSPLFERGYLELLPDPLPTTPGSVILVSGTRSYLLQEDGAWRTYTRADVTPATLQQMDWTVLFDAGA